MPSADCRMLMERNTHPNGRRRWVSPFQCACFQAREATAFPPFALGRFSRRRDVRAQQLLTAKSANNNPQRTQRNIALASAARVFPEVVKVGNSLLIIRLSETDRRFQASGFRST